MTQHLANDKEIHCLQHMVNPDESSHLKCYKHHLYAYMTAMGMPADLLLYGALEPTAKIGQFVYDEKGYKWQYDSTYLGEEDWFLIGVYAERPKVEFDFDTLIAMAKHEIDINHPVLFFAPRIQVPYFQTLAPIDDTAVGAIDNVHSFFLCGYNSDTDEGLFFEAPFGKYVYRQALAELRENYQKNPGKWFTDCYAVYHLENRVDHELLMQKHRQFIDRCDDDHGLYDRMCDSLEIEFLTPGQIYDRPFLNAVTLLFGSRVLFKKFIDLARYPATVTQTMNELVRVLRRLDTDCHNMLASNNASLIEPTLNNLVRAKQLETELLYRLKNTTIDNCLHQHTYPQVA